MTAVRLPYTFDDALHRTRMNIMRYQDCVEEDSEQYRQHQRLLEIVEAAPELLKLFDAIKKTSTPNHAQI